MSTLKLDVELLLDDVLPFAKSMLAEYGEFHPYGGFMRSDGSIVHVGATHPSTDRPRAADLLELLREEFRRRARSEGIKAAAVVHNVHVTAPDKRKTDAIQATVEHADAYCADVFFPYRINEDGAVEFGGVFAQEGEKSIFPGR